MSKDILFPLGGSFPFDRVLLRWASGLWWVIEVGQRVIVGVFGVCRCGFRGLSLKKTEALRCLGLERGWGNPMRTNLSYCGVGEQNLRGAVLRWADLRWADLRGADLRGAVLRGADLRGAVLRGADLRWADLRGADLQGADLQGADLQGADLRWANLRGADLRGADLRGADLRGADLRGADLQGADLPSGPGWKVVPDGLTKGGA